MNDDFMTDFLDDPEQGKESLHFIKVEGLGNDFIVINCLYSPLPMVELDMLAMVVCDRDMGLKPDENLSHASDLPSGADGLALIEPSDKADFKITIYNADGSPAEMCGNLMRALGWMAYQKGFVDRTSITVDTPVGVRPVFVQLDDKGEISAVKVGMGEPSIEKDQLEIAVETALGDYQITPVSTGNPHGVVFVEDLEAIDLKQEGPLLERHELFPKKANIEFTQITSSSSATIAVWERGAGVTQACGTGACAALVAGVLTGRLERKAEITLPGGAMTIEWDDTDNQLWMTGPASVQFEGIMTLPNDY